MRYELQYDGRGEGYFLSREAAHGYARELAAVGGRRLERFRVVPVTHGRLNLARKNRVSTFAEPEVDPRIYGDPAVPFAAQHWYSGQGDPLYALASTGWPQPLSTAEWALANAMRARSGFDAAMRSRYGRKRRRWSSEDQDADDQLRELEEGLRESVRRRSAQEWY